MATQLYFDSDSPEGGLRCNLVAFHPADGELPFFSWSDWTLRGPGISRTGINPPSMRQAWNFVRSWITTDNAEEMRRWCYYIDEDCLKLDGEIACGELVCGKKAHVDLALRRVAYHRFLDALRSDGIHTTKFLRRHPGWTLVGQVGAGDTTMNNWHVAFVWDGTLPKFLYLEDEPIREREYPCLVKWTGVPTGDMPTKNRDFFSIELNARFVPDVSVPQVQIDEVNKINEIEFALSGKPILNKTGEPIPLNQITHFFRDLRHLFRLPKLSPPAGGVSEAVMFGQPITADLWFGEKQLLDDLNLQRAACKGPVLLDRLYGGLSVTRGYLSKALENGGYIAAKEWVELKAGEFRIDDHGTGVEIYFREAVYPWNIVAIGNYDDGAIDRSGQSVLLSFVCGGLSGRSHYTLREAIEILRREATSKGIRLQGALLLDEGGDVFQKHLTERNS